MSEIPEKVWIQYHGDASPDEIADSTMDTPDYADVSWCWEKIFDADIEYVRAEEMERIKAALSDLVKACDDACHAMSGDISYPHIYKEMKAAKQALGESDE